MAGVNLRIVECVIFLTTSCLLVLVTGAFSDYATDTCVGDDCLNPQINLFDVTKWDAGENPWSLLLDRNHMDHVIDPGIREYTRVFVLPGAIVCADGIARQVLLLGRRGQVALLSVADNVSMGQRLFKPINGLRPLSTQSTCGEYRSDQSTAVPLVVTPRGPELLIMCGCQPTADFYNVNGDYWHSLPLGILRNVPSSLLLPNGLVMLINGEGWNVDQNVYSKMDAGNDPRFVQLIDVEALTVYTETARGSTYRGYHNMAAVLSDGSIVTGGGYSQFGDVGCEEPNLQLFFPSYLAIADAKPIIQNASSITLMVGEKSVIVVAGNVNLHPTKGVALLAVQSFTHSYGQNQRYIPLPILSSENGVVVIALPPSPILLPGHYHLFVMSNLGKVSSSIHAKVIENDKQ
jgi:hypothetical protein